MGAAAGEDELDAAHKMVGRALAAPSWFEAITAAGFVLSAEAEVSVVPSATSAIRAVRVLVDRTVGAYLVAYDAVSLGFLACPRCPENLMVTSIGVTLPRTDRCGGPHGSHTARSSRSSSVVSSGRSIDQK